MNITMCIGNLTRAPELRTAQTANGAKSVCSFTIAVNKRGNRDAVTFYDVSAWGTLGENCAKYLSKGRKAFVRGEVGCHTYTAHDGTTKATMRINADEVEFLGSAARSDADDSGAPAPAPAAAMPVIVDDLPF